ncbi:MAG TPA: adenosine kinase [Chlamydiales bacterium]|nr:adenosine kinase [Chlamydiales bacterium]
MDFLKGILLPFICFTGTLFGYEVLSIGAPIADYFVCVSDEEFQGLGLEKDGWKPISEEEWQSYHTMYPNTSFTLGGSGLNVIKSLSHLGLSCAFLGKMGLDHLATALLEKMESLNIQCLMQYNDSPTPKMYCFITPDKERTMRTFRGIESLADLPFSSKDFENVSIFHIAGYEIENKEMVKRAFAIAKSQKCLISLDLGSAKLVEQYKEDFIEFIKEADIVFGNADEAKALTSLEPMYAVQQMAKLCPIAVVTMGEKGGWVKKGKEHYYYPSIQVEVKDTTGAGDFFTSGFLYGLLRKKDLRDCAYLGAFLASEVIKEIGTDLPEDTWKRIRTQIGDSRLAQ